jgi:DNA-binding transcriptional LysR family regulator
MDVTTDFLRTFIAVCECKSFSLATARVHKSQPAISTQIAKLEEQAGYKFIDRSQRQFRLTQAGELFLNFAHEVVAKTDAVQPSLTALKIANTAEVRIGATRSVGIYLLPEVIGGVVKKFPNLRMTVISQARALTYECLQQGTLDFAVVLADAAPRGLISTPLRSEPLCFVISPKHPLANKKVISRSELQTVPFIHGVKGNEFSDLVDEVFEKSHIPRPPRGISISNLRARKEAARAGVGITVLPKFTVRDEVQSKSLKILAIEGGRLPDTQLMIVEARRRSLNTKIEWVKNALVDKLTIGSRHH